jgi:hypothetical protein
MGGTERPVIFSGLVVYEDDIGTRRSTGFYRRYEPKNNSFVLVDDLDREYAD